MPTTERIGLSKPESASPGQVCSCSEPSMPSPAMRSFMPPQPPTRCRPMRVSGSRAATITKNCSTSL